MTHCSNLIAYKTSQCSQEKASLESSLRAEGAKNVADALAPVTAELANISATAIQCATDLDAKTSDLTETLAANAVQAETIRELNAASIACGADLSKTAAELTIKTGALTHAEEIAAHNSRAISSFKSDTLAGHNIQVANINKASNNAFGDHSSSKDAMYSKCVTEMTTLLETAITPVAGLLGGLDFDVAEHTPAIEAACGSHNATLDLLETHLSGLTTVDLPELA